MLRYIWVFGDKFYIYYKIFRSYCSTPLQPSNVASTAMRRGCGRAKNNSLKHFIDVAGYRPKIEIPIHLKSPVGKWATKFKTELGIISRNFAPLSSPNWTEVSDPQREIFYKCIEDKFDIDLKHFHHKRCVNTILALRLKEYRGDLHKHFKKFQWARLDAHRHPYRGVSIDDWKVICTRFKADELQKISKKNSKNRAKQVVKHCGGSKSFVQYLYERNAETEQPIGRIELWKRTHYKEPNGWMTQCEEYYDEMRRLQSESMAEGAEPLTEEEICAQVLGRRPGYVRDLGHGMIAPPLSSRSLSAQTGDLNRRYQEERLRNQELHSQIEQLNENMQIEVQSQVQ
ncbi:hypothetical protein F0562_024014 [Nyssa sinensis]|uniref:Transposase, Ptta/En/Spm, plant n=1 Tax=Nyssa sinensis TaxID=561372 RepID=A0A5J5BMA8_9ASTE|nr:hypothetical protein F0562_024014 [Nyssa sinensis]